MKTKHHSIAISIAIAAGLALSAPAIAHAHGHQESAEHAEHHAPVADSVIAKQREALAKNTEGKGFGPQSPRDIDSKAGSNPIIFSQAPDRTRMNLCNIHFHKYAEHKGGQFSEYAGNGDGEGNGSGYKAVIALTKKELKPTHRKICDSPHSTLRPGDTIEVHYVHSTAPVKPGPTLGSCLADGINNNPQLRVEAQVYVLVNDPDALDFVELTRVEQVHGKYQAVNMPTNLGEPVHYIGSTTGPGYNEKGSPYQVSWSVYPNVAKVDINSVGKWCEGNIFNEDHAHGVRNLVKNPKLLSEIH